ncbi:MAG: hypothetical protein OXT65_04475 [Alphaproteobacteria bacterium]|nr:hypothetical protein [Alphaproteobacteria bacterium]
MMRIASILRDKEDDKKLAHIFLPDISKDSALLPPDSWVRDTLGHIAKQNKVLQKSALKTIAGGMGSTLGLATGAALFVALPLSAPVVMGFAALGLASLGGAYVMKKGWHGVKEEFKTAMTRHYMKFKVSEMHRAWAEKAEKNKAKALATPKVAAPATTPPVKTPAPNKEPQSLGMQFGKWMLKTALDTQKTRAAQDKNSQPPQTRPALTRIKKPTKGITK